MDQSSFVSHCVAILRSRLKSMSGSRSRIHKSALPSGQVDVLEDRVLMTAEFGDAPSPYPVTLADNGARHSGTGPRLGLTVDTEADGANSVSAQGDGVDEDGIVFGAVNVGRTDASVLVKVRTAAHGTKLDAWIDFNGDGDWNDAGEKIFNSKQVLNNTNQTLTFTVPDTAVLGATYARFRISSAGGLNPTGAAADGEVEDLKVTIGLAAPSIIGPAASAKVEVTGTQRVTFTWTAVPKADNYEVWVRSFDYEAQTEFVRTTVTGTEFTPDVNFGSGRYTVWVRSLGANNTASAWTAARPFVVVAKPTIVPMTRLQTVTRPEITWTPVLGAQSYKIWIANLSTGQSPLILKSGLTTTSFTPSAALPLGTYRVWVAAVAGNVAGSWSLPVDFVPGPAPTPTQIAPTFGREVLSWSSVAGAVAYEVQLKNLKSGANVALTTVSGTTFTPSEALLSGEKYRWWVRGKNAQNVFSAWSGPSDFYAGGQTEILTPTGTVSNLMPTFTWKSVTGAARYELSLHKDGAGIAILNKKDILTNSFTPTTALSSGTYRVWVRAISVTGTLTTWSLPVSFTIAAADAPAEDMAKIPRLLASLIEHQLPQHDGQPTVSNRPDMGTPSVDADAIREPRVMESAAAAGPDVRPQRTDRPLVQPPMVDLVDLAIDAWVNGSADLV